MKYSKNILFLTFLGSFLAGVFCNNITESLAVSGVLCLIGIILFFNFYIFTRKALLYFFISIVGVLIGAYVSFLSIIGIEEKEQFLSSHFNREAELQLEVKGVYKITDFFTEYEVELSKKVIHGILRLPSNFDIRKGDILSGELTLFPIRNFSSDFEYKKFLYSKGLFFKIYADSIHKVGYNRPHFIIDNIDKTRQRLLSTIHQLYPHEEALFLGGILLGARESLPEDLKTDFNNSGLTHFIAVSGFNITVLIIFLGYLFKILPSVLRLFLVLISLVLFTLLVGDSAPVIRAVMMGSLGYFILFLGRNPHTFTLILLTAFCMVLYSPLSLNYDVSFHLSFLAVLGIVYTQVFFKKVFFFLPQTLAIQEAFVLTLSALAFTLPVMIFNFGQVSTMALFSNIAVTWTVPFSMLGGFVSIIVYYVFPAVATWIAYFTWILLAWDIKVVHFFGGLDWSLIQYDFGVWRYSLQVLYFVVLGFVVVYFRKSLSKEKQEDSLHTKDKGLKTLVNNKETKG